jgi:enoyl-CoA hydratase
MADPFSEQPYCVVRLDAGDCPPVGALCPIIGIGTPHHPAAPRCDVVVADEPGTRTLIANIAHAPIAALALVQTLRATMSLPLHDALVLESLAYGTLQGGAETRAWLAGRAALEVPPPDPGPAVDLVRRGDTLNIVLNRPSALNAVNLAMRDSMAEGLMLAALDNTIKHVNLSGRGRCFSVGGALEEFGTAPDPATAHAIRCITGPAFLLAPVAAKTTAHVHGACIGAGMELAALCARVHARANAFFQLPEIRYGLMPGSGGTAGIARRIGRQRTAYLALSARRISARLALEWGLVDAITPDGDQK